MKRAALLSTALIIIPTITQAQCVATTDCASLGYTQTSCPNGGLKCPFANYWSCKENTSTSTTPEPPTTATLGTCTGYAANCKIADILNTDGSCTSDVTSGKVPLGVVVAIKDNCGYAMTASPIQRNIRWSSIYTTTGIGATTSWSTAITNFDACANTQKIIQQGSSSEYPAAWAAVNYAPSAAPATKGKWCLPAPGMLNSLYKNLNAINSTISMLGGTQLTDDNEHIWSSSEESSLHVWTFCTLSNRGARQGGVGYDTKDGSGSNSVVRPVLAF